MDFLYNKKLAVIFSVAAVAFSIFVLGGNSLKKEAQKVNDIFYGQNEYTINVEYECLEILAQSNNLLTIAKRQSIVPAQLIQLSEEKGKDNSPGNLVEMTCEMHPLVYELIDTLEKMDISDKDRNDYLVSIRANLDTCFRKIGLSGYNDHAVKFNAIKSDLYAKLIAAVRNIDDMPLFIY